MRSAKGGRRWQRFCRRCPLVRRRVERPVSSPPRASRMAGASRKQQIEAMLADDPNDTFLNYALAMEHVSAGQDQEAVGRLEHLIQIAADYVPAYFQAAQALVRL